MVYGIPDFQSLTVERLYDSVIGNWPAVLLVSPKNAIMHNYSQLYILKHYKFM